MKSGAALSVDESIFTNCKEYAICQETKSFTAGFEIKDLSTLSENFPDVTLQNCIFDKNLNGNVLVKFNGVTVSWLHKIFFCNIIIKRNFLCKNENIF